MGYATIDKNGKFTGTVYTEITENVEQWHKENDFTYAEIDGKLKNTGTDENPDYGSPTPKQLKAISVKKAKQKLKDTMSSGCEWNGYTWGCDETDRKRFQEGLVLLDLMQFENCNVWTMDGTKVTVTAAEYRQLCTAIAMTFAAAFEVYRGDING